MNPNESEFEEHLRSFAPAAPPPALAQAIARELHPRTAAAGVIARPRPLAGFLRGLGWACAGACVAIAAIVLTERTARPTQPAPAAAAEPASSFDLAESSAEILAAQDEGVVYADGEAPARLVRFSSIERRVWTDADTGARVEIEIPREDIRLTPVTMQ